MEKKEFCAHLLGLFLMQSHFIFLQHKPVSTIIETQLKFAVYFATVCFYEECAILPSAHAYTTVLQFNSSNDSGLTTCYTNKDICCISGCNYHFDQTCTCTHKYIARQTDVINTFYIRKC